MRLAVLSVLALGTVLALSHPARADSDSACGAVLCLAGEAAGQGGGSSCTGYLTSYFSIRVFKGGDFKPGDTLSERANFLNQCSSAPSGTRSSVNSQYGGQEFGP
ncbi:TrbM/KikA/MpfK family conjugal transfer protein [Acidocella sp.]|uniref:TrbM/KikA/MpfK family conjugal transfer protein n=1 Tax=Acidocella sp. TaxID=50710 RepID=UPI002606BBA8|nr:TrbM/KikA/MpfK family conjugal transfer protein [Acidocella sp.]MDD2794631.1 TrbM/KikA/MpfK family conjugal transfer protein [Acidocella sp.]